MSTPKIYAVVTRSGVVIGDVNMVFHGGMVSCAGVPLNFTPATSDDAAASIWA